MQQIYDKMTCKQLFTYLTKQQKQMNQQSFSTFITDVLELKEDDIIQFYILTHFMKVDKAGHISIEKLQNMFDLLKVKTVKDLKKKIPQLYLQIKKSHIYKQMYRSVFSIFLINSTTMDIEYAQALWAVLLKEKLVYLPQFLQYLNELGDKKPKRVHKDLWNMMLQFGNVVKDIDSDYKQNDAWPLFIDNFAEWVKKK